MTGNEFIYMKFYNQLEKIAMYANIKMMKLLGGFRMDLIIDANSKH
jgi:hypothetical protein